MKQLKSRLRTGETLRGCWLNLGSTVASEIVGSTGFDWVLVDLEHGSGSEQDIGAHLQALEHTPAGVIVRVESAARQRIGRVLDAGAEGIMCPRINDAQQARQAIGAMRYAPAGTRGVARMIRATAYGREFAAYHAAANQSLLGVIQIETVAALDNLGSIAAVDGVDVLFAGPADLSMDLGVYGEFNHPLYVDAIRSIVTAAERAGRATGILLSDPDDFAHYQALGFRMIACGADSAFVVQGARQMLDRMNSAGALDRDDQT
jgi:4-hydroxy-2-oxoheptanedioate aldolase